MNAGVVHVDLHQALVDVFHVLLATQAPVDNVEILAAGPVLLDDLFSQIIEQVQKTVQTAKRRDLKLRPLALAHQVLDMPVSQEGPPVTAVPVAKGGVAQVALVFLAFNPLMPSRLVIGRFNQAQRLCRRQTCLCHAAGPDAE